MQGHPAFGYGLVACSRDELSVTEVKVNPKTRVNRFGIGRKRSYNACDSLLPIDHPVCISEFRSNNGKVSESDFSSLRRPLPNKQISDRITAKYAIEKAGDVTAIPSV
jgi:hypothetical protein